MVHREVPGRQTTVPYFLETDAAFISFVSLWHLVTANRLCYNRVSL